MRPCLLFASLFTLAAGPVVAQVPRRPTTPPVPQTTGLPASSGAVPAAAVPAYPKGYTTKHLGGTTSPTFPNGLPERDLDHGTSRDDQPRANQAQAGAQPTRSIFRKRR
ncbi:hypothetical protein KB206_00390 [Microvirga sp. STS02]|uniref:hypothetical protein n=1 Tax=Hymenobacter negativus TaxID=2795026 RepID=UPI0018DE787C|nr:MULTISPECIES: hypothetical protein [Bacteria]MBH8567323.1 hypothetical protein [Hymenobacter negativus]MBR7207055.1 hypothetical protein [Microvirga sp. STS02]